MSLKLSSKALVATLLLGGTVFAQGSDTRPGVVNFSDAITAAPTAATPVQTGEVVYSDPAPTIYTEAVPSYSGYSEMTPMASPQYTYMQPAAPAAPKEDKPKPTCAKSHKGLFYANDFSYLSDPAYDGNCLGDSLKQLSLGRFGKLDIGGQLRHRYHSEFGQDRQAGVSGFNRTQNDFSLFRARLYANWQVNDRVRVFAEGIYADVVANDEYLPRPIDRNRGDFLNLFVDLKLERLNTNVRIGRQELLFGDQRLISPLDWANTRRTFEGVRTTTKMGDWTLDGFLTEFVPVSFDEFDDSDSDRIFYGAYANYSGFKNATADLYYIGFNNNNPGAITNNFDLHTLGTRLNGNTQRNLLYDFEGGIQFGDQDGLGQDHEAYFVTAGLGYKFKDLPWSPTLWGYYDFASGNDSSDGDFNRFNDLFPLGHKYLGFIDAVARSNIKSPNARLTMQPSKKTKLLFWYYYFEADQVDDIIPGVATPANQNLTDSRFGNELDVVVSHQYSPRLNITGGYSHFWRGDRIIGDNDADFFYLQTQLNF